MCVRVPHSEHRFPAPSSKEGCRKPVLGVWVGAARLSAWKVIDEGGEGSEYRKFKRRFVA